MDYSSGLFGAARFPSLPLLLLAGSLAFLQVRGATAFRYVAGGTEAGFVDGPAALARFSSSIERLLVDPGQGLLVIDAGNGRIRRIDSNQEVTSWAGGSEKEVRDGPRTQARFKQMVDAGIDSKGNLYIFDRVPKAGGSVTQTLVRKLDTAGMVTTLATWDSNGSSFAVGADGRIAEALVETGFRQGTRKIMEHLPDGSARVKLWEFYQGSFAQGLGSMAYLPNGDLLVESLTSPGVGNGWAELRRIQESKSVAAISGVGSDTSGFTRIAFRSIIEDSDWRRDGQSRWLTMGADGRAHWLAIEVGSSYGNPIPLRMELLSIRGSIEPGPGVDSKVRTDLYEYVWQINPESDLTLPTGFTFPPRHLAIDSNQRLYTTHGPAIYRFNGLVAYQLKSGWESGRVVVELPADEPAGVLESSFDLQNWNPANPSEFEGPLTGPYRFSLRSDAGPRYYRARRN